MEKENCPLFGFLQAESKSNTKRMAAGTVTVSYSLGEQASVAAPMVAPIKIGSSDFQIEK